MKEEILSNLGNAAQLERLYRSDKSAFKREFRALYPNVQNQALLNFWNERLNFVKEEISWGSRKELIFIIAISIVAGIISKMPAILHIDDELFYSRNIGFIVFPALIAYFAWKNKMSLGKIVVVGVMVLAALLFINLLPNVSKSDTIILSRIHLLIFLWTLLGFAFVNDTRLNEKKRLEFLSYNGDLVVITALIVIAGGILSGVTIGLFHLIGYNIENFYFENIVAFALPAAPILGTYLTQTNPQLVGKVSPVIAKIFSPLVLVMLLIYLGAIIYSGKDPYNDREFLLVFNVLLVGVMAIIFFSVAGSTKSIKSRGEIWILFLLSAATAIVNGIALSAILFRISEWGITPNRAAVLGGNILILMNLLLIAVHLERVIRRKTEIAVVGKSIAYFIPVYSIWALIVTFLFPLVFGIN